MNRNRRIAFLLATALILVISSLPLGTYLSVRETRRTLASARSIAEVERTLGQPSRKIEDYEQIKHWTERYSIEVAAGDTLFVRNREGLPYWVIIVVSPDGINIRSRHAGYHPLW